MKKNRFLLFAMAFFCLYNANAQQNTTKNIFDDMRTPDSETGATVTFYQDEKIENLLKQKGASTVSNNGTIFRVQVFSSNNQKTAKTEAFNTEKKLKESFPYENVQVNYTSPFWKVRIGEFATREEATTFRQQIVNAFPDKKAQIYVIADRGK
jgi:septal ring-binding cell division protein DamX